MSKPKERSVKFRLDDATEDGKCEAPRGTEAAPKDDGEPQLKPEDQSHHVETSNTDAASDSEKPGVDGTSLREEPQKLKSALKGREGAGKSTKFVYCRECGEKVPLKEWPDHRDRLREVKLVEQVSTLSRRVVRIIGELLIGLLKNVYFREVTVVGSENVPQSGAVVFYGNHQNQFMDALMIASNCQRAVRFIMAEKSFHHPIIGFFGRMFRSVPVIRPQDMPVIAGSGRLVYMSSKYIRGEGTNFIAAIGKGDVLMWCNKSGAKCTAQVSTIKSDTEVEVTLPIETANVVEGPTEFRFSRRIDHSEMYANVYSTLQQRHCIGIFPEGGSHDRTSLLPLKAGVALFSLGAAERDISVKVVPCGLTYFYGYRFRSRAYIEFGEPITPPAELVKLFDTDKRKATGIFLEQLNQALRNVTINVPDWRTLNFLHSFRQLYKPPDCTMAAGDYLRLMRRLSFVIEAKKDDADFVDFRSRVESYADYCNALLIRDSQTATLKRLDVPHSEGFQVRLLLRRSFMLFLMAVILVPFFVVGLPVGAFIEYYAAKRTKKALSESKVKVVGADVKGSFKVILGFAVLPVVCVLVSLLVFLFTDMNTALVAFFCLPMALYVSLLILQEAVLEVRAALPLMMSLLSKHKQFKKLYKKREELAHEAAQIVHKCDPQLEQEMAVYTADPIDDEDLQREPSLFSLRYNARRRLQTGH